MSPEDVALCQQAIELANSGQKQAAYKQFCLIYSHGNTEDVTLLYWIAFTTPSLEEAQRAVDTISHLEPDHPKLQELQAYVDRKRQRQTQEQHQQQVQVQHQQFGYTPRLGAVVQCPYCHNVGPTRIASKVSTGGWITLVVLLVLFIPLCWIGLLIREDYYVCSYCGIKLG
jgi:hypothetical protein